MPPKRTIDAAAADPKKRARKVHVISFTGNTTVDNSLVDVDATDVTIQEGFESIASSAFNTCHHLINVILPESMKSIKREAFICCDNLKSINLENVQEIGSMAFFQCVSLCVISIPKVVQPGALGEEAIYYCFALHTVNHNLRVVPHHAFAWCYRLRTFDFSTV